MLETTGIYYKDIYASFKSLKEYLSKLIPLQSVSKSCQLETKMVLSCHHIRNNI